MIENYYRIAGVDISIRIPESLCVIQAEILEPYRVDMVTDPEIFTFSVVKELDPPQGRCCVQEQFMCAYLENTTEYRYLGNTRSGWENAYLRGVHDGKCHNIQVREISSARGILEKTILSALTIEHLLAARCGVILHASCIAYRNKAILFTAPCGTGKSTQADLWVRYRDAELINGDRIGIRVTETGVLACGIPFAGSSGVCKNRTLPIAAIVYLAQAPETSISKLNGISAFRHIWEGCSVNQWNRDDVSVAADTAMAVVNRVPVYYMPCTPDETAVSALEQMLKEQIGL